MTGKHCAGSDGAILRFAHRLDDDLLSLFAHFVFAALGLAMVTQLFFHQIVGFLVDALLDGVTTLGLRVNDLYFPKAGLAFWRVKRGSGGGGGREQNQEKSDELHGEEIFSAQAEGA